MQNIRSSIAQAGSGPFWLADARIIQDGALARVDIRIEDGRIAALAPLGTATDGISLDGGQVWPGLVDGHTHLDKGHIWPRMKNATGDFAGAIAAVMADRGAAWTAEDIAARADFALRAAYAYGTVAIRSHIDSYLPLARTTWPVFSELRARWEGRIALQISSIAPLDRFQGPEGDELADLVQKHGGVLGMVTRLTGGIHAELPGEFQPMLDHFFGLAEARGLDLDLHVDESGETGARALREIALTATRRKFKGRIQCGHCCSLSLQPDEFAQETIAALAEAGIDIIVLPMCNMYLQDRAPGRTPRWRGVTLVHEMRAAGLRVSLASDNTRDPFYAYGDLDMVEVYREATRILHLDHPLGAWPDAVSAIPAEALGLKGYGRIAAGAAADLILFSARGMTEFLSRPQSDRIVLRAGRVLEAKVPDYRELDAVLGVSPG